jgi:type I restriction enzyme M protein
VVKKGQPKNFIPEDQIRFLAAAYLTAETVDLQVAVITRKQAEEADYNLSPSRWVTVKGVENTVSVASLFPEMVELDERALTLTKRLHQLLAPLLQGQEGKPRVRE